MHHFTYNVIFRRDLQRELGIKLDFQNNFVRDLQREVGIKLDFQNNFVSWKESKMRIKYINCKIRTNFTIQENKYKKMQHLELRTYWMPNTKRQI